MALPAFRFGVPAREFPPRIAVIVGRGSSLGPLDQLELATAMLRVAGGAVVARGQSVEPAIVRDEPLDLPMALQAIRVELLFLEAVAV